DDLHRAISVNRKITFQYAEWTEKKKLRLKHDGAYYIVSPWALTWDDENYYLIAYDEKAELIKHYRVDKMLHINLLDQERLGEEHFKNFDLAAFAKKTFGMYGGRDESVTLTCCNE
ncbi:helix-turn-helix transcriptional regulator, partial [Hungatella effluvii]